VTVHHVVEGVGGPLVLSSSLGTTHRMYDPIVAALARRHTVVRYDHPGHGGSPPGPRTIEGLAGEALALADELGLDRFAFCGVSLGGMVGIWLAAHAAERLERLVVACTAPRLPPREAWQERADTVRAHGVEVVADTIVGRWFTGGYAREHPETVRRYRAMLVETPPEGYARCCEAIRDLDLRDEVARVAAPTTVVFGAHDPVVGDEARRLLGQIAGALTVQLDAAHLASVERPREFAEAVLS
jgi:3-oxoadipate enol-lactonase